MWEAYLLIGKTVFVLTLESSFELIPKMNWEGCWLNIGCKGREGVTQTPLVYMTLPTYGHLIKLDVDCLCCSLFVFIKSLLFDFVVVVWLGWGFVFCFFSS